uniref:Heat shock protein 75 kDa, mitochondrial n=2 Tax=Timema TaxID=61471 RepID=A0A7R9DDE6_TIMCR|nr:unnamed protein product [Timema cristinae]
MATNGRSRIRSGVVGSCRGGYSRYRYIWHRILTIQVHLAQDTHDTGTSSTGYSRYRYIQHRILTIQDTGVGMTKEELVDNLGTIARSGSKAFLEQLKGQSGSSEASSIIGQFGVGFYSSFMVADRVEVFTKSSSPGALGYKWTSDGTGSYEIQEAEGVSPGTKIVLHLKPESREFSDEDTIRGVIKKYSNFVGCPIFLNGQRANVIQVRLVHASVVRGTGKLRQIATLTGFNNITSTSLALVAAWFKALFGSRSGSTEGGFPLYLHALWLMDPKEVTPQMHDEFYRFVGNTFDKPRFTLHYRTDAPLTLRALLYFPEGKPGLFEMNRESDAGVALYSRKVLIKSKTDNILPKWLRFVKGVVDSEDIPLNLSRELLQNSALIRKLQTVLTNRLLRFLHDKSTKEQEQFDLFYKDYSPFLKEGIVMSQEQLEKEEIAKLLRFESSRCSPGEKVSLPQYIGRLAEGQKDVFYLAAPSRALAEASPYYEALRRKDVEVLFCSEPYDELVLMQLRQFDSHNLTSVEKEMRQDKEKDDLTTLGKTRRKTTSQLSVSSVLSIFRYSHNVTSVEKEMRQDKEKDDLTTLGGESLLRPEVENLLPWLKKCLGGKVHAVKVTRRLDSHPCVITVEDMGAARHFLRMQSHQLTEENRYALLQPQLEINPSHPIIKKLSKLVTSNPRLAELVSQQLLANAMVSAGLVEDPRTLVTSLNELLSMALEAH